MSAGQVHLGERTFVGKKNRRGRGCEIELRASKREVRGYGAVKIWRVREIEEQGDRDKQREREKEGDRELPDTDANHKVGSNGEGQLRDVKVPEQSIQYAYTFVACQPGSYVY